MAVKIVTDSTSDLTTDVARALGITVVPVYVRFGDKVYRDKIDIDAEEFFSRMMSSPTPPSTSAPSPGDFAEVYKKLAQEADAIVSIHLTSKLSATYSAAVQAKDALEPGRCQIEVVDSQSMTMGLGLIAIAAARAAQTGESLERVLEVVRQAIARTRLMGILDSLKYALRGGRLGKAAALLGAMLNVKPLLTMKEGELAPIGFVRTRAKGMERLLEFARNALHPEDVAIVHSTTPKEAETLAEKIKSLFQRSQLYIARLGPALGAHGGPGTLVVALREGETEKEPGEEGRRTRKSFSLPSLRITQHYMSRCGLSQRLRERWRKTSLEPGCRVPAQDSAIRA
jgi:DegV family protein with EDD domain